MIAVFSSIFKELLQHRKGIICFFTVNKLNHPLQFRNWIMFITVIWICKSLTWIIFNHLPYMLEHKTFVIVNWRDRFISFHLLSQITMQNILDTRSIISCQTSLEIMIFPPSPSGCGGFQFLSQLKYVIFFHFNINSMHYLLWD